jgi:two-component system nitrogen regulation sensor histidine kinase NtrY
MTTGQPSHKSPAQIAAEDIRRRRREAVIIIVVLFLVALLTFVETKVFEFGDRIPVSNTVLMFILININLLLLLLLLFLVFRNLVKLIYDRRRRVMGAQLRTRLVAAFITLTLVPTSVLFFFSLHFITSSLEFWFNLPIEQSLENSLWIGEQFYRRLEGAHQGILARASRQIEARRLLAAENRRALAALAAEILRETEAQGVEVYSRDAERLALSLSPELENDYFGTVPADTFRKQSVLKEVHSLSAQTPNGEIIKTVGTVPFGADPASAEGFVVIASLVPIDIFSSLKSVSRGIEEYEQIKLVKKPIQLTYFITLSIVLLVVVFFAVWFGFLLAKTITIPLKELAEGARRVAGGDLSVSIAPAADTEIGSLVEAFNRMTRDLQASRLQLELSAERLREQNAEIEAKRQYMEIVLGSVSTGVVTLDAEGRISTLNRSAERMLACRAAEVAGRHLDALFPSDAGELAAAIAAGRASAMESPLELPIRLAIGGKPRSFLAMVNALRDPAGGRIGTVVAIDDLTELERAQRLAAWREVARRIAHEVKNPLTPITLSAQRLKRRYAGRIAEPVFDECTRTIIDHVEVIRNLVNEFAAYARFPSANPVRGELPPIIEETLALYREGYPGIRFETDFGPDIPPLNLDRLQIKQALINLIENAIVAVREAGRIEIAVRHDPAGRRVQLEVADDGPGVPERHKSRLFEPDFSTKKSGMGLGLTIVSSIVADHNGAISLCDNRPRGARFVIELPV